MNSIFLHPRFGASRETAANHQRRKTGVWRRCRDRISNHQAAAGTWRTIALCIAALGCVASLAQAPAKSEVEALRQELQAVRGNYERRIQELELRLRDLEAAQTTAARSAERLAATVATNRARIDTHFQSLTEVREQALLADPDSAFRGRLEQVLHDFIDFGG